MGRNTGNGTRIGITRNRYQAFNPKTKQYVKFDSETKKIMSSSTKPYKNIRFRGVSPNIIKSEKTKLEKTKKTKFITTKKSTTKISKRGKRIKKSLNG